MQLMSLVSFFWKLMCFWLRTHRLISHYGLNPALPEIEQFYRRGPRLVREYGSRGGRNLMHMVYDWLDPRLGVTRSGSMLIILQAGCNRVLNPTSLADYWLGRQRLENICSRIVIDYDGTYLEDAAGNRLVWFQEARISQQLIIRPSASTELAAAIVRHYTGLEVDWKSMIGAPSTTYRRRFSGWVAMNPVAA